MVKYACVKSPGSGSTGETAIAQQYMVMRYRRVKKYTSIMKPIGKNLHLYWQTLGTLFNKQFNAAGRRQQADDLRENVADSGYIDGY